MAKLKSLGLTSARKAGTKAIRKLFGRESPAVKSGHGFESTGSNGPDHDTLVHPNSNQQQKHLTDTDNNERPIATNTNSFTPHDKPTSPPDPSTLHSKPPSDTNGDMAMQSILPHHPQRSSDRQGQHPASPSGKENQPRLASASEDDDALAGFKTLSFDDRLDQICAKEAADFEDSEDEEEYSEEQAKHLFFTQEALDMARLALRTNETPVGCVLVHNDKVIARGMNATNVTRNGTRHAEFMALSALLSYPPKTGPRTTCLRPKLDNKTRDEADDDASTISPQPDEGNEDGSRGHLYPYGQKEYPVARVDRSIIRECVLYVTVEPCIMCASLLRQLGIKKVYFGAVNDKFGGTGGVFSIHANSLPVSADGQTASAHPQPPPTRLPGGGQVLGTSFPPRGGDGGNVEPGYEIEGGWGRDDAVGLLRRFYVQENERAPVPRKKEGRAARLAAMMEQGDNASTSDRSESAGAGTIPDGDILTAPSADGTDDRTNSLNSNGGRPDYQDERDIGGTIL